MFPVPSEQPPCQLVVQNAEPLIQSDSVSDLDEPPDGVKNGEADFPRQEVFRHGGEQPYESLLTKALRSADNFNSLHLHLPTKRTSMASNVSVASTAELTCDTGNTSPARLPSPSPPHPAMTYVLGQSGQTSEKVAQEAAPPRQRCVSFACAAPPEMAVERDPPSPADLAQNKRRPMIKFACPPQARKVAPERVDEPTLRQTSIKFACPDKAMKSPAAASASELMTWDDDGCTLIPVTMTRGPYKRASYGTATRQSSATGDSSAEISCFDQFSAHESFLEDWIIQDSSVPKARLTMWDILRKELAIRELADETLSEDEDEDDENEADMQEDDDALDFDDDAEYEDDWDDDDQDDGLHTDNESAFGDWDDEDEEDVEVEVPPWFPCQTSASHTSVESVFSAESAGILDAVSTRRMKISQARPMIADSADFVCGAFDEDRVVEDLYMIVVAARKRFMQHAVPQDIDPSFPFSDPEDEDDNFPPKKCGSMEEPYLGFSDPDAPHVQERGERPVRRSGFSSSRSRYRSPPPNKRASPPFGLRRLYSRPLGGRTPSRNIRSPPFHLSKPPRASSVHSNGEASCKPLASRPGFTNTKSLSRPAGIFPSHLRLRRKLDHAGKRGHTRGAIDIVKGPGKKQKICHEIRAQKYCGWPRKGQIPEKKAMLPGQGAARMRELGLYMAGKLGPGRILSI